MYKFVYKPQHILFDDEDNIYTPDELINNQITLLKQIIMKNTNSMPNTQNIKDSFYDMTIAEVAIAADQLAALDKYLEQADTNLDNLKAIIATFNDDRIKYKKEIVEILTNIYLIRYRESINKGNAIAYQQFNTLSKQKANKYYKQYD